VITNPEGYVRFAEEALLPFYRQIGRFLTEPNPRTVGIVMLILEVVLAALILGRGRWVKVGILGAILFLVGISPLGFDVMPNLLLAAALVYLMTQDFPRDAFTMFATDVAAGPLPRVGNREARSTALSARNNETVDVTRQAEAIACARPDHHQRLSLKCRSERNQARRSPLACM
jgi:hypothetical protein